MYWIILKRKLKLLLYIDSFNQGKGSKRLLFGETEWSKLAMSCKLSLIWKSYSAFFNSKWQTVYILIIYWVSFEYNMQTNSCSNQWEITKGLRLPGGSICINTLKRRWNAKLLIFNSNIWKELVPAQRCYLSVINIISRASCSVIWRSTQLKAL